MIFHNLGISALLSTTILLFLINGDVVYGASFAVETSHTYAAGLMYDADTDRVYITGEKYSPLSATSDCWLGILQLPRFVSSSDKVSWIRQVDIGVPDVSESCSAIYTTSYGNSRKLYLAGHAAESPSVLSYQHAAQNINKTVYGMVLDLTWFADVKGGYLMENKEHSALVEYPTAITGGSDGDIYVASLLSNSTIVNPAFRLYEEQDEATRIEPDMTTAGGYSPPAFGDRYVLGLQRIGRRAKSNLDLFTTASSSNEEGYVKDSDNTMSANLMALKAAAGVSVNSNNDSNNAASYDEYSFVEEALVERWGRVFAPPEHVSVQISSLLLVPNNSSSTSSSTTSDESYLVLAGSTRGSGSALGGTDIESNDRAHGFVTVFDTSYGVVRRTRPIMAASSSTATTTRALGLCRHGQTLYVVGTTDGYLEGSSSSMTGTFEAFLQKMNADTLQVEWTKQLKGSNSMHALGCAVTPDGKQVYMGGTVIDGGHIVVPMNVAGDESTTTTSHGLDDLFVAQYDTHNGALRFARQIGTEYHDRMANGEALACDKYGNALMLGNIHEKYNKAIILSVNRVTGEYVNLDEEDKQENNGASNTTSTIAGHPTITKYLPSKVDTKYILALGVLSSAVLVSLAFSYLAYKKNKVSAQKEKKIIRRYEKERELERRHDIYLDELPLAPVPPRDQSQFALDLIRPHPETEALEETRSILSGTDNENCSTSTSTTNRLMMLNDDEVDDRLQQWLGSGK